MKKIFAFFFVAVGMIAMNSSRSLCQEAGTELDFMNMGAGARPAGMGGAFSSVTDDANAVYWNPAGLALIQQPEATWMHTDLNFGTAFDYVAAGAPLERPKLKDKEGAGSKNRIGIGWLRTSTGDILLTGISADTIPGTNYNRVVIQGLATFLSNAFMFSYARSITQRLCLGATAKILDVQLASSDANGYGLDVGILWGRKHREKEHIPADTFAVPSSSGQNIFDPLAISLVINDATVTRLKWNSGYTDKIAPNLRFGLSYGILANHSDNGWISPEGIILATDIEQQIKTERQSQWHKPVYHAGLEWKVVNMVPLRAGYDDGNFACGIGFITKHFGLDYAYNAQQELKAVHKIAISGRW